MVEFKFRFCPEERSPSTVNWGVDCSDVSFRRFFSLSRTVSFLPWMKHTSLLAACSFSVQWPSSFSTCRISCWRSSFSCASQRSRSSFSREESPIEDSGVVLVGVSIAGFCIAGFCIVGFCIAGIVGMTVFCLASAHRCQVLYLPTIKDMSL